MPPQKKATREPRKQTVLRLVSEQVAIPLDQLARFLDIEHAQIVRVVSGLRKAGCINQRAVTATDPAWVWLTPRGAQLSKTGYPAVRDLAVRLLTHRRAINEVRLYLEERAPRGHWLCERAVQRELERNVPVPDGVFEIGGERHAIEVELSRKSRPALCEVIASHSSRYDAVVYFCAPYPRTLLEKVLEQDIHPKLIVRDVPGMDQILATRSKGFGRPLRDARAERKPSGGRRKQPRLSQSWERYVLTLISEQGAIPMDQLARFLDHQPEETVELVERLCVTKLARRGRLLADEPEWVWLTYGGARFAETEFRDYWPALGALARLRAMNEVRLHIAARAPQARWIGWRTLRRELRGLGQIPDAVVEVGGERHAIEVEMSRREKAGASRMIEHRSANYDAVVCFCTPEICRFYKRLAADDYWPKLIVRPLPAPDMEASDSGSSSESPSRYSVVPSTWDWCPEEPNGQINDAIWAELEPLIPKPIVTNPRYPGRSRQVSDRMALSGVLYVARYRIGFRALPRELGCGSGVTCHERLRSWERAGAWADVQRLLEAKLPDGDRIGWSRLAPNPSKSRAASLPVCKVKEADGSSGNEVDDVLWAELEPLIPKPTLGVRYRRGVPRQVPDRAVLSALLFVSRNKVGWRQLPRELYGPWFTSYQRVLAWRELEGWDRVVETLAKKLPDAGQLDWSRFHSDPARRKARHLRRNLKS